MNIPVVTFIAPVLPAREEEWRRFVQEVAEERLSEYEGLRRRLGFRNESVWLAHTKGGETAMVYLEAEDPERMVTALATSKEPFDVCFKEQLLECHGRDLVRTPRRASTKLIFSYQDVAGDGHGASDSGHLFRREG